MANERDYLLGRSLQVADERVPGLLVVATAQSV